MSTTDEKRQRAKREAKLGDPTAQAAVAANEVRYGEGIYGVLQGLVGKTVYIEGIRINYRGPLVRVILHSDGAPGGLLLGPGTQRISYFQKAGPNREYTFTHEHEVFVPYEVVHHIAADGFREGAWPAL